jgi:hypothetical protein
LELDWCRMSIETIQRLKLTHVDGQFILFILDCMHCCPWSRLSLIWHSKLLFIDVVGPVIWCLSPYYVGACLQYHHWNFWFKRHVLLVGHPTYCFCGFVLCQPSQLVCVLIFLQTSKMENPLNLKTFKNIPRRT